MLRVLIANTNIKKGEKFTEQNLICKRSNNGIPASKYFKFLGKKSKFIFKSDESIK